MELFGLCVLSLCPLHIIKILHGVRSKEVDGATQTATTPQF